MAPNVYFWKRASQSSRFAQSGPEPGRKLWGLNPTPPRRDSITTPLPTPISGPGRLKVFFQDCWLHPGTPNCTQRYKGWEGSSCRKLCLQVWVNNYQHHGSLSKKEDWWRKVLNKDSQQSLTRKGATWRPYRMQYHTLEKKLSNLPHFRIITFASNLIKWRYQIRLHRMDLHPISRRMHA